MAFALDPAPTFVATVRITKPGQPAEPLQMRFRHKTTPEFREFVAREQTDAEMVHEIVDGVLDRPAGMTDAQFLERLLGNFPAAALDIYLTYCQELGESRAKNSERRPS